MGGLAGSATAGGERVIASRLAIRAGRGATLEVRQTAVEDLVLRPGEAPYDLAFALRVGALDGRHPEAGAVALQRLADVLTPDGPLLVGDGGDLSELRLPGSAHA